MGADSEDGDQPISPKFRDPIPDIKANSGGSNKASKVKKKRSNSGSKRRGKY